MERSPREHREWLDGLKTQIEWCVTLLKRIEDGVLPAEPEVIDMVRKDAIRLHKDQSGHEHDDYCRESCVDLARRSALLTALAERLEVAATMVPVTPEEAECLGRKVLTLQLGDVSRFANVGAGRA